MQSRQYLVSKSTTSAEIFANDNYLEEPQDIELKETMISFIREFKDLRKDTKKQLSEIK